jgi:predicted MFS family arabinose efflux permease
MGYITFCNTLSVMGATFLGGQIAEFYGWLAPFWGSVGVGFLGLLSLLFIYERPTDKAAAQPSIGRLRSVLKHPELVLASIVAALGQYTTFATIFGFVPNYAVSIGATKAQLGILSMVGTATSALAILVSSSYIVPRLGARLTVFLSFLSIALGTLVLPFIHSVTILYASQVLAGMGRGSTYPILMGLAIARLPDSDKATAMGFFQATYAIGMFAGPVCAGLIGGRWGYAELFLSTAVVTLFTAFYSLRLPRKGEHIS